MMNLSLVFGKPGYIAHPYRHEMYQLIEVQKKSGMMRTRSDKKRRESLEAYLRSVGMDLDDYLKLEKMANEPFYRDGSGGIIIPADKILSCLVNASAVCASRMRIGNIRVALRASDFSTGKQHPDGKWERFAVVTGAQGKLSNQRALRVNEYICDFTAKGTIDHGMVSPKALLALIEHAGREVGIGASRKMGWGRFSVMEQN